MVSMDVGPAAPTADDEPLDVRQLLGSVQLLRDLPEPTLDRLALVARVRPLATGEYLFYEGDATDAMYLVVTGSLEVVSADVDGHPLIRMVRGGEVVGEIGILTHEARSASVRATRDSTLVSLGAAAVREQLMSDPGFATSLIQTLAVRLRDSRAAAPSTGLSPRVVAVASADDADLGKQALAALHEKLAAQTSIACIEPTAELTSSSDWHHALSSAEQASSLVLLDVSTGNAPEGWRDRCLANADRVLLVIDGAPRRVPQWARKLSSADLVYAGSRPEAAGLGAWKRSTAARVVHHVGPAPHFPTLDRLARSLTRRSVGIVLSGGGAPGMAHIGVLKALSDAQVTVERVAGTSAGALVGCGYAMGMDADEITEALAPLALLGDPTLPVVSLMSGRLRGEFAARLLGARRIEELPLRYYSCSTNLRTGEAVYHHEGPLGRAVMASSSIPGIYPPVEIDGELHVDGALVDNLPVGPMLEWGEGPIIGVDLTPGAAPQAARTISSRGRLRRARNAWASVLRPKMGPVDRLVKTASAMYESGAVVLPYEQVVAGMRRLGLVELTDETPPGIVQTLLRSLAIVGRQSVETSRVGVDVLIEPEVVGEGLLDMGRIDDYVDIGYAAARDALDDPATLNMLVA